MANWTTRRFDEIAIGDSASYSRTLAAADIELVAMLTGDRMGAGQTARPGGALSTHSIGASVLLATAVGTQLPGPGAKILEESLRFNGRVTVNDVLTAKITVREKRIKERQLVLDAGCTNQKGETVAEGSMRVECPEQSYTVPRMAEVDVAFRRYNAFQTIFELCEGKAPVTTAVVHPCDRESLLGAFEAVVGPDAKIRAAAKDAGVSLDGVKIVVTEHSHAAADRAVAMARAGEVEAMMKGSLHTDELMSAVIDPTNGLRTARRVSHVFVMDVPTYPKPLLITDAAINIYPDLDTKRDICQNAIDLAQVLRVQRPKVAILSAIETVNPKMQGTVDAAALCKMADRGQITGGILDGPLAFDNAISAAAARIKEIDSPVAGDPDILVAPDLEAGNLLAKTLAYLAAAESAGVVLGARVPIVLTSRADSARNREASAAVMALLAHSRRDKLGVR
ncbi:MAG: bifunctional enoyl-CoA hydratase/phosphate acetyltransferase [Betaproteobacteria bacterium]|nr:MAG: bifunctional enoyl-CoA hydratase/phosphate acetyltransferase [Betaproteobacteria bacterium]